MSRAKFSSRAMSQCNQGTDRAIIHQVPLFASSWVALFVYLRDSLGKGATRAAVAGSAPGTGGMPRAH